MTQIAMGVNDADSRTRVNVLENKIAEERRLACSGFADAVQVMPAIFGLEVKRMLAAPSAAVANIPQGHVVTKTARLIKRVHVAASATTPR